MTKQFRQFVSIEGIPSKLLSGSRRNYTSLRFNTPTGEISPIFGADGTLITTTSPDKAAALVNYLRSLGVDVVATSHNAITYKSIVGNRPRKIRGNLMFVIEDDDEENVLKRTRVLLSALDEEGIPYHEVCKWFCLKPEQKIVETVRRMRRKREP